MAKRHACRYREWSTAINRERASNADTVASGTHALRAERAFAVCAKRAYTGAMRTARKIRYRLEWLGLKFDTKFLPLLSRKACYRLARLVLLAISLLFLNGSFVNAGPVGDFFKKVGHSISKPLQSQSPPPPQSTRPQPANTPQATRRRTSRAAPAAAATAPAVGQPSHPPKEEELTGSVRPISAADIAKAKAGLPYGIPVPGRKGMVSSPYLPEEDKYIDVTGFASGAVVKDPYTGKFFLVP